jgi:hypothetical protein
MLVAAALVAAPVMPYLLNHCLAVAVLTSKL